MPSIQSRISNFLLKRIRERREAPSKDKSDAGSNQISQIQASPSLREATFDDFQRVSDLTSRLGQGPDSIENWTRLWKQNPAIESGQKATIGWVLEAAGDVVGFLGSIPLLYTFRGKPVRAAATCRLAIDLPYRAFTHLLLASFFRQKQVDVLLNTTATEAAGKMMLALKANQLPQPNYGEVFLWVLNPGAFSRSTLRRLGLPGWFIGFGTAVSAAGLYGRNAILGWNYRRQLSKYEFRTNDWASIGQEFLAFWQRQENARTVLLAKRTPAIMKWHFEPPHNRRPSQLVSCSLQGELKGYVIVRHDRNMKGSLRGTAIVDLMADQDDPDMVRALLAAALRQATLEKSDIMEVIGFAAGIRGVLKEANPLVRYYPACPFFYKTSDKSLGQELASENAWYACPFDGDSSLWP